MATATSTQTVTPGTASAVSTSITNLDNLIASITPATTGATWASALGPVGVGNPGDGIWLLGMEALNVVSDISRELAAIFATFAAPIKDALLALRSILDTKLNYIIAIGVYRNQPWIFVLEAGASKGFTVQGVPNGAVVEPSLWPNGCVWAGLCIGQIGYHTDPGKGDDKVVNGGGYLHAMAMLAYRLGGYSLAQIYEVAQGKPVTG